MTASLLKNRTYSILGPRSRQCVVAFLLRRASDTNQDFLK